MNVQVQQQASLIDIVKQVLSVVFLISGIAAFYYFSNIQLIYRVISLLVVVIIVIAVLYTTVLGKSIFSFFLESKQEVKRVVWPTREETTRTTMLVFAMVFTVGLVLWLLDMFLFWGVRLLTGQGA
jgi:preprotein translocase subunit SecE